MEMVFSDEISQFVGIEKDWQGYKFKVILNNGRLYPSDGSLRTINICSESVKRFCKEIDPHPLLLLYKRRLILSL